MTNLITLTIPNDDHVALRAFGKALEEMALAHGAEPQAETLVRQRVGDLEVEYLTRDAVAERLRVATDALQQAAPRMMQELHCEGDELQGKRKEPEVDTTAQQVESLVGTEERFDEIAEVAPTTDNSGTPWDERIHSASKALNSDGTWRLRRKPKDMDEAEWVALVESIKNELQYREQLKEETEQSSLYAPENYVHMYRAADNIYSLAKSDAEVADFEADGYVRHTQEQYDAWEGPNTADEGDDHHTDAGVVTEQTVAGIPPIPVPPPVVVAPPVTDDWTFPKLMTFLTERQGKIDVATVNMLLAQDGIASLPELNAHPDKIGPFVARVKAHLGE